MNFISREENGILTIQLGSRLDLAIAGELEKALDERLDTVDSKLVLDCTGLTYISSAGLRVILKFAKALRTKGKEYALENVNSEAYKIFKMTGFTNILNISHENF